MDELKCSVIEINRGTTHDGPGMRMTFFLKGCPLSCFWCQNPEGMHTRQEVWWEARKCIGCLECIEVCPYNAVSETGQGLVRDRSLCQVCGGCVDNCPAQAVTFTGQEWEFEQLVAEALKDRDYYQAFGGGVTVSGGEPLMQFPFVAKFFERLQGEGVHTALDTCGLASRAAFQAVLPHTDAVLYDIKLMDDGKHKKFTGQSNVTILENLLAVAGHIRRVNPIRRAEGKTEMILWIRTPLIPGATTSDENITAIGNFIHENLGDLIERWELCAFNPAAKSKYQKLGMEWIYADTPLMGQGSIDAIRQAALSTGIPVNKLVISGLTATEK